MIYMATFIIVILNIANSLLLVYGACGYIYDILVGGNYLFYMSIKYPMS